ncbi:hypothetical protein AQJ67_29215 [Streptomyces caeruleatus]|uniref:Uncharacterized protein n=1 Tax=Streptomyces caeruleatus TaxID=661399 RepID=A0A101TSW4_9ACTN|nr:hypothetical protein AQJ67_29215 [Streptomyces caeruleatus]
MVAIPRERQPDVPLTHVADAPPVQPGPQPAQATTLLTRKIAQAHGHHRAPGRSPPPRGSGSSRASHRSARFTPGLLLDITPVSDVETKTTGCMTAQDHMARPS